MVRLISILVGLGFVGVAAWSLLWGAFTYVSTPQVETVDVFDVYRGPELPNGRKSVAILVLMRDTERTLTDADGDRIVAGLLTTLTARFGATLRSQAAR